MADSLDNPNTKPTPKPPQPPRYADGLRFTCTQCGNCCTGPTGFVWFDQDEQLAMAEYLGLSVKEFRKSYVVRAGRRDSLGEVLNEQGDYDCVFLETTDDGKRTCSIYPVRPTQCRTWPFWDSNLRSPRHWKASAITCPGMKAGGTPGVGKGEHEPRGNFYPLAEILTIKGKNPTGL